MEDQSIIDDGVVGNEFSISENSTMYLNEIRKWAQFLSIVGFVLTAIMVVFGLFFGSLMGPAFAQTGAPAGLMSVIYIAMALLYFFPIYYLFKFSSNMRSAIAYKDNSLLESAFQNLKSFFKFIGIFTIIIIGIYALLFVGGLGSALVFGSMM